MAKGPINQHKAMAMGDKPGAAKAPSSNMSRRYATMAKGGAVGGVKKMPTAGCK